MRGTPLTSANRPSWPARLGLFVLVLAAHVAVLAWLGLRAPAARFARMEEAAAVEVFFLPRPSPRRDRAPRAPPASRTAAPSTAPTAAQIEPVASQPQPGAVAAQVGEPSDDPAALRQALRNSLSGCANREGRRLTPEQRDRCNEQMAARGATAPAMPLAGIEPAKVAYYAAVQEARKSEGHGPRLGCSIRWGAGKLETPKRPRGGLKIGPCVLGPPAGMFTVEADLTPPGLE